MRKIHDITGQRFGKLVVQSLAGRAADHHLKWHCLCDCGNTADVASTCLRRGMTKSCGCLSKEAARRRAIANRPWNEGKSYAANTGQRCYRTRQSWAKAVIRHYGNRCERCGWDKARCDAHHRTPKSTGGLHTITNGIVLCPNCHRIEHNT